VYTVVYSMGGMGHTGGTRIRIYPMTAGGQIHLVTTSTTTLTPTHTLYLWTYT